MCTTKLVISVLVNVNRKEKMMKKLISFFVGLVVCSVFLTGGALEVEAGDIVKIGPICDFKFSLGEINPNRTHHTCDGAVDFAHPGGTPVGCNGVLAKYQECKSLDVRAAITGRAYPYYDGKCGKGIELKSGDITVRYCHLKDRVVKKDDVKGKHVRLGQKIAEMTSPPDGSFVHVHVSVEKNGSHLYHSQWKFNRGCTPPSSGDWVVKKSCYFFGEAKVKGDIYVQDGAVLTIDKKAKLNVDFQNHKLVVENGSGVLIKKSAKIH